MCGGFKPSRQFAVTKDEQIARELARLARLKSGQRYHFPTDRGLVGGTFGGYARHESLEGCWKGRIRGHIKILAETFSERNTVEKTYQNVHFRVPEGKAIHAVVTDANEVRIVTQPARGNVKKYHHRMPDLI